MSADRDVVLLETVRTHRGRLLAAFLFGDLEERRIVNDNRKRVIGSMVLAAVVCAGCVGFSFVTTLLADQAAERAQQQQQQVVVRSPSPTPSPTPSDDREVDR